MRRILAILALVLLTALPAAAPAAANERRELVVGVEELEYYPLYAVRDGEYVGAAREILDAFAAARNYRIVYRPLPIKRLYADLIAGRVDLKFPDNQLWASDTKKGVVVTYSKPVIAYVDGVMVRPINFGREVDNIHVLGTVAGFSPTAWNDRVKQGGVVVKENPRMELLLRQVVVGHVDGAYASIAVASHVLNSLLQMPGALVFDPRLPHSRGHYHLSSTTRPEVVAEFDAWLAANGPLVKLIKDNYGAEKFPE